MLRSIISSLALGFFLRPEDLEGGECFLFYRVPIGVGLPVDSLLLDTEIGFGFGLACGLGLGLGLGIGFAVGGL
jgi:hypothetical protein